MVNLLRLSLINYLSTMIFFIIRLCLYYTQCDLKQMAKFIDGGRGGEGLNC